MMPFCLCPLCGGKMVQREVEELLRGGAHLATVTVEAEVCLRCGERLYSRATALRLEQVRRMLVENQGEQCKPLGVSFQIPA